MRRWAQSHPRLREWTLRIDDTPVTRQDRWRRPDVLAVAPDGTAKVAFEAQYSALTGTEWKARHDFYADSRRNRYLAVRPPRLPVDASHRRTTA